MSGYAKLKSSIVTSTIWREPPSICKVWITLLALSDRYGQVEGSVPGLADMCRLPLEETEVALKKFLGPDPWSRSKEYEGRRIEEIDGGWLILNYQKHRAFMSAEDRREQDRLRQERHREKERLSRDKRDERDESQEIRPPESIKQRANAEALQTKPTVASLPDWLPKDAWDAFLEMRKKLHKVPTERAKELLIEKLLKLRDKNGDDPREVLERSVMNGWQGIFELPKNKGNDNHNSWRINDEERRAIPERTRVNATALEGFRANEARRNSERTDSNRRDDRRKDVNGGPDSVR